MPIRRTIGEWTTLLEIEPALRYIFVEGESDQWLIATVFNALNRTNVSVRLIQDVYISESQLHKTPFNSGNRAKLLAFSSAVQARMTRPMDNMRCIVDLDCDAILPRAAESRFVRFTDSANMLVHFAEYPSIRHTIGAVYGHDLSIADFETVVDAAVFLFVVRVLRYSHFPQASSVDPYKSLTIEGERLRFAKEDYVQRFAMRNGLIKEAERLLSEANDLRSRLTADPRRYMNSHDFLSLLYGALKRRRYVSAGVTQTELNRVYQATITIDRLHAVPLIDSLCAWANV